MPKINKFDKRLENIPGGLWTTIAKIDELKGRWIAGANLSPQTLGRLKRSVLVTSSGASTRIEGAKLSDEEVEKVIKGLNIQKFSDRDEQEARGYFELLEKVFSMPKEKLKFSESIIKSYHKELLKYVSKDERHRGEYKPQDNKVEMFDKDGKPIGVMFEPTSAYLTPKEMSELVEWTVASQGGKKYHPLLVVGSFVVEFLKIHPFQDGNGRLSRILTNMLMLMTGYDYMPYVSHEKLIEDNKADYYIALRKSQKSFNSKNSTIIPWLEFFLNIVLRQSEAAVKLMSGESMETILTLKQLAVWDYIQSHDEATSGEMAKALKMPKPTVNQAIDKLLNLKKIERLGMGRGVRYRKL